MRLFLASLIIGLFTASNVVADTFITNGMTFSDEMGGFRLLGASGTGTKSDPFVIIEEINSSEPVVLVIRGFNKLRSGKNQVHVLGLNIKKIVRNATERTWFNFDMELREEIDQSSGYGDGLSFDQAGVYPERFVSDRFLRAHDQKEPYDGLAFRNGMVRSGEVVIFDIIITDPTPVAEFYLMQTSVGPLS